MKKIIFFSFLFVGVLSLKAQKPLEVEKADGNPALIVHDNGFINIYNALLSFDSPYSSFISNNATDDGIRILIPGDDGIQISNPGNDGMFVTGAPGHGVEIDAGTTGLYVHNQANQGIYSDQAGREAGWFRNATGSSYPCLRVTAGNENVSDIYFGGHGRMESQGSFVFNLDNNNNATESFDVVGSGGFTLMKISEDAKHFIFGDLAIGSPTHATGYRMSVDGKVMAEEVRVELSQNWPDYVFNSDYELMSLEDLANEIEEIGHLPGVPAAQVVESEGFDLGEMNRILLEKVEELTLHVIDLNKQLQALKK